MTSDDETDRAGGLPYEELGSSSTGQDGANLWPIEMITMTTTNVQDQLKNNNSAPLPIQQAIKYGERCKKV